MIGIAFRGKPPPPGMIGKTDVIKTPLFILFVGDSIGGSYYLNY
jgi:hypothetical protein